LAPGCLPESGFGSVVVSQPQTLTSIVTVGMNAKKWDKTEDRGCLESVVWGAKGGGRDPLEVPTVASQAADHSERGGDQFQRLTVIPARGEIPL